MQRDYILRMIEQIGEVLIALRRRILGQASQPADVEERLNAFAQTAGLDLELARAASPETLHMLVAPSGEADPSRSWLLAEFLYLDGLQAEVERRLEDARASFEKARMLYGLIEPGGVFLTGWPEAEERAAEISEKLKVIGDR